jgi:hypothetical protein
MDDFVFSKIEQTNTVLDSYNHVVILGAGASKASCLHKGEKNGRKIPLMNDLPKFINIDEELKDLAEDSKNQNFEQIFSTLYKKDKDSSSLKTIEKKIYDFFKSLELPNTPTIYDYLVLSLRKKDLIATFNWDPFLIQAYRRNSKFTSNLPKLAFLHGNVAVGIDANSKTVGIAGERNPKSGNLFVPTKLLYPVEHKNYQSDIFIKEQWNILSHYLTRPSNVSIFGYSAPKTDVEAISIMKKAWGNPEIDQRLTQFEIIDIQTESQLKNSWKDFIFSHHYRIINDFFKSSIARHPRRSGEIYKAEKLEGKFCEDNYPPKFASFSEMWEWFTPLIEQENLINQ